MDAIRNRRRALMMQQAAPAPSGYITNGLIMFLDGLDVASNELWVDSVGGARYTLYNATKEAGGGVTFSGQTDSYGESSAIFPSGVTIEAGYRLNTISRGHGIFSQYWDGDDDRPVPILVRSTASSGLIYSKYASRNEPLARAPMSTVEVVSAVVSTGALGTTVANGELITRALSGLVGYSDIPGSRLGARGTTASLFMDGTLYFVRIYNRALTEAEMLQNQRLDNQRYNLGLTIPD